MFSIFVVEDNDAIIGSLRLGNHLFPWAFGSAVAALVCFASVEELLTNTCDKHVLHFNWAGEVNTATWMQSFPQKPSPELSKQIFMSNNEMCTGLIPSRLGGGTGRWHRGWEVLFGGPPAGFSRRRALVCHQPSNNVCTPRLWKHLPVKQTGESSQWWKNLWQESHLPK